jgi:universal stress protein A
MNSSDTLLVATDFSEPATNAVRHAAHLASCLGYRLRILHAVDALSHDHGGGPKDGEVESRMAALISSLPDAVIVESRIRNADAATTILHEADEESVAALVVGYSGKSGLFQRIGSTASKVARRSRKPVFILTASFSEEAAVIGCLDFSETSRTVIDWTRRLKKQGGHPGHFAHVAIPLKRLLEYNLGSGEDDSPIPTFGGSEARYKERLEGALRQLDGLEDGDEVEICFDESTERGLEDLSAVWYPALLVLGRTERNALHDRLLGSTAEHILDYSDCSTLVVAGKENTL